MLSHFKFGLLSLCGMLLHFSIAEAANVTSLTQENLQQIARAEHYLNARTNFSAKFLQGSADGQVATGTLLVSRPGKMNITYDPPLKDLIIADGSFVNMWDGELEQSTVLPLGGSLADLILRANLHLSGDVQVTKVLHEPSKLEITVRQKSDPEQGTMTLVFEDNPLIFHGWRITDSQDRTTSVTLQNMQDNAVLSASSFVFVSPKLGKNTRSDKPLQK
jgi:outer membrane lipoprotein-sorting protein